MRVPLRFGDAIAETATAHALGFCDVTALPRVGIKGPAAAAWLAGTAGLPAPGEIYQALPIPGGGLVARVGGDEFLIEDGVRGNAVTHLDATLAEAPVPGLYRVPRQDAAVLLTGSNAPAALAEVCAVDFRKPQPRLVYTRVAGVSCGLHARTLAGLHAFQLWIPPSYGEYLFETLLQVVRDHGGGAIGMTILFPELGDPPGPRHPGERGASS
jgi:sarcosine oxidase subunit gamma